MLINVTFRHVEPSTPLRSYAEEKLSRLKKYLREPIDAHVVLKVEKFRHIAEASVDANGLRLNGAEETEDMYSAIDRLADTLESQAERSKDRAVRRKGGSREMDGAGELAAGEEGEDEEREPRIIATEQVYAKPMDVDEAAMQLKLSGCEFMVFTNRTSRQVNVLYKRKDGNYGLIETLA